MVLGRKRGSESLCVDATSPGAHIHQGSCYRLIVLPGSCNTHSDTPPESHCRVPVSGLATVQGGRRGTAETLMHLPDFHAGTEVGTCPCIPMCSRQIRWRFWPRASMVQSFSSLVGC